MTGQASPMPAQYVAGLGLGSLQPKCRTRLCFCWRCLITVRVLGLADAPDTSRMLAVRPDSTIKGDTRSTSLQSVKACQCL